MTQTSYAILTATGSSLLAQAIANNTTLNIAQIVIGEGTTVPTGNETSLYGQVAVKDIADYGVSDNDAATFWFSAYLKAEEGPYAISEIGLLDKSGNLIAIGHLDPAIEKPIPSSGQTVDMIIGLYLKVYKASAVTVTVSGATPVTLSDMETLPWIPVESITLISPPDTASNGDVYYVPVGATDEWSGMVGKLAQKTTGGWRAVSPIEGHGIGLPDGSVYQYVSGAYARKLAPIESPVFTGTPLVPVVSNFTKEQALGAKTADGRYIGKAVGSQDFTPLQGGINKSSGEIWFSYLDDTGAVKYAFAQVPGDYATNPALESETKRATTIESNLQTSLNTEVNRAKQAEGNLQIAVNGKQPTGDYASNTSLNNEVTRASNVESNLQSAKVNRNGDDGISGSFNVGAAFTVGSSFSAVASTGYGFSYRRTTSLTGAYDWYSDYGAIKAAILRLLTDGTLDILGSGHFQENGVRVALLETLVATAAGSVQFTSRYQFVWDTVTIPARSDTSASDSFIATFSKSFSNACLGIVGMDTNRGCHVVGGVPNNNDNATLWSYNHGDGNTTTTTKYIAWGT